MFVGCKPSIFNLNSEWIGNAWLVLGRTRPVGEFAFVAPMAIELSGGAQKCVPSKFADFPS
jgi:hypothetical protein